MMLSRYQRRLCGAFLLFWLVMGLCQVAAATCGDQIWAIIDANKNNQTALSTAAVPQWVSEIEFRGSFSILQSCVLTLASSVYTALHLNVPYRMD